eukprot:1157251-Pelagomonas_calceolata.AAC.6
MMKIGVPQITLLASNHPNTAHSSSTISIYSQTGRQCQQQHQPVTLSTKQSRCLAHPGQQAKGAFGTGSAMDNQQAAGCQREASKQ